MIFKRACATDELQHDHFRERSSTHKKKTLRCDGVRNLVSHCNMQTGGPSSAGLVPLPEAERTVVLFDVEINKLQQLFRILHIITSLNWIRPTAMLDAFVISQDGADIELDMHSTSIAIFAS